MNVKASELRIENLVRLESGEIVPIKGGGIAAIESGYLKVEPIPITKGRLINAGFNENICFLKMVRGEFGKIGGEAFELRQDDNGIDWVCYYRNFNEGEADDFAQLTKIQYIHQLQNIWIDLTGEELIQ